MKIRSILVVLLILSVWVVVAHAGLVNLGVLGKTYPIREKDHLAVVQKRARNIDWQAMRNKQLERLRNFRPANPPKLPRAKVAQNFHVDVSHTLEADIPNAQGGVIYPKGYHFNPLDYINYTKTLVVIDGTDEAQLRWFEASGHSNNLSVRFLVTDGFLVHLMQRLQRPIYYADAHLVARLGLTALPAIVRQSGEMMEVIEIAIPDED